MKIESKFGTTRGHPQPRVATLPNARGTLLLTFAVLATIGSLLYAAGPCCLTIQGPCSEGLSYTNTCPDSTNTFVWTVSAGPDINICPCWYTNGYFDCTNDPVITNGCVASYTYTACPGIPAGSGSITNNAYPYHAIRPGCPAPPNP